MTTVRVTLDDLHAGIDLPTGEEHRLVLQRIPAHFIELGSCFTRGSSIVLPDRGRSDASVELSSFAILKQVLQHAELNPARMLLVVGHGETDSLSEARAKTIQSILTGDRDQWAEAVKGSHKPQDIQLLLRWAARDHGYACDPGTIDGVPGPKTERAMQRFSHAYNREFGASLSTSAPPKAEHWRAFFDIFEISFAHFMNVERGDLAQLRSKLNFLSDPLLWCGRAWPASSARIPGLHSRSDQGVHCVFVEKAGFPPLQKQTPPGRDLYGTELRFKRGLAEVADPPPFLLRLDPQVDEPHAYRLHVAEAIFEGRVQPSAPISCKLKNCEGIGELFLWPTRFESFEDAEEEAVHWKLELRAMLAPITTMAGAELRLQNLGYECGECNGEGDSLTQSALRSFQEHALGSASGQLDDATQSALKQLYGA